MSPQKLMTGFGLVFLVLGGMRVAQGLMTGDLMTVIHGAVFIIVPLRLLKKMGGGGIAESPLPEEDGIVDRSRLLELTREAYAAAFPEDVDGTHVRCGNCGNADILSMPVNGHPDHDEHFCPVCEMRLFYSKNRELAADA